METTVLKTANTTSTEELQADEASAILELREVDLLLVGGGQGMAAFL
jgi:hypothetical protein